jgi:hypothetical protein
VRWQGYFSEKISFDFASGKPAHSLPSPAHLSAYRGDLAPDGTSSGITLIFASFSSTKIGHPNQRFA